MNRSVELNSDFCQDPVPPDPALSGERIYNDCLSHLTDELFKLDLILSKRIHTFRKILQKADDAVRAAPHFVSHEEVDHLMGCPHSFYCNDEETERYNKQISEWSKHIDTSVIASQDLGVYLPLLNLSQQFNLRPYEIQIIIICLAPELRRKYDRIYAYLQDEITFRRPSIDFILQLLFDSEIDRWQALSLFGASNPLVHHKIIKIVPASTTVTGSFTLSNFIHLDERIIAYLLGHNTLDKCLINIISPLKHDDEEQPVFIDEVIINEAKGIVSKGLDSATAHRLWLHLVSREDAGPEQLALSLCRDVGCQLINVDIQSLLASEEDFEALIKITFRESILSQAALLFVNFSLLLDPGKIFYLKYLYKVLEEYSWLVFSISPQSISPGLSNQSINFRNLEVGVPRAEVRVKSWEHLLADISFEGKDRLSITLGQQYRLTMQQIKLAVKEAQMLALSSPGCQLTEKHFFQACRSTSTAILRNLATHVIANYEWNDLVLPESDKLTMRAICQQVKHHDKVFNLWGFDKKLAYGKGLSVLFSGKPGTGKTMAAQVIAHELNLTLYKIDLSSVVSKYIGETEKNLERIFEASKHSNVILFFDEADALFGKRSEISDAHDRYANIETSYLLQKIEEYDGIVILASNYKKNMDEAFVRRIRFIIEFPFPDVIQRKEIWQKTIPTSTPVKSDIDFDWLAKQMKISGGSIKNIVLNSAFYAVDQGSILGMYQLQMGCRDEFKKMGRMWDETNMPYSKENVVPK